MTNKENLKILLDDFSLIYYKAISSFVQDLNTVYGTKIHQIALYTRLIENTSITHTKAILKHVDIFKNFCISNRDAIVEKDVTKLVDSTINYSNKVFLDIKKIFSLANSDESTANTIWSHLLTISALLDPTSKAKAVLKESSKKKIENNTGGKEEEFISKIIEKVEKNIDPSADPTQAAISILQSGAFSDMFTSLNKGMENGELDLTKLMGVSQSLLTSLSSQVKEQGGEPVNIDFSALAGLTNMLPGLMGNMITPNGRLSLP